MMIERKEPIHSAIFIDTGWEFPQMYSHINFLECQTKIKIWRLRSWFPFDYLMTAKPIVANKGSKKGKVHKVGMGWPSSGCRWCTGLKRDISRRYYNLVENAVWCIGYASDELHRKEIRNSRCRMPLQEWNITEADALQYCYDKGYYWDGLYEHFSRVSCFCCPLQRLSELRKLWKYYPELWQRMLDMDSAILINRGFKGDKTVHDLDRRFRAEYERCFFKDYWA